VVFRSLTGLNDSTRQKELGAITIGGVLIPFIKLSGILGYCRTRLHRIVYREILGAILSSNGKDIHGIISPPPVIRLAFAIQYFMVDEIRVVVRGGISGSGTEVRGSFNRVGGIYRGGVVRNPIWRLPLFF
jgi:hypothetical protein